MDILHEWILRIESPRVRIFFLKENAHWGFRTMLTEVEGPGYKLDRKVPTMQNSDIRHYEFCNVESPRVRILCITSSIEMCSGWSAPTEWTIR